VLPDRRQRILSVTRAATAASALGLSWGAARAESSEVDAASREAEVLQVLHRAGSGSSGWLKNATFEREVDRHGVPSVLPLIPVAFGNSYNGVFDVGRARQLAAELFTVYGLHPHAEPTIQERGVSARLDLWDPAARVGCKLRGRVYESSEDPAVPHRVSRFGIVDEDPGRALDDAEQDRLAAAGCRIQVVDLESFPRMDGDQVTSTLAYLAGIVDFLNWATDGPDLDLSAVMEWHDHRVVLPIQEGTQSGCTITRQHVSYRIVAPQQAEISFVVDRNAAERSDETRLTRWHSPWKPATLPFQTANPVLLQVPGEFTGSMTVTSGGEPRQILETAGSLVFFPTGFDLRTPFTVSLRFEPGTHYLDGFVLLRGVAP
jgi:hypothetical protein